MNLAVRIHHFPQTVGRELCPHRDCQTRPQTIPVTNPGRKTRIDRFDSLNHFSNIRSRNFNDLLTVGQ